VKLYRVQMHEHGEPARTEWYSVKRQAWSNAREFERTAAYPVVKVTEVEFKMTKRDVFKILRGEVTK